MGAHHTRDGARDEHAKSTAARLVTRARPVPPALPNRSALLLCYIARVAIFDLTLPRAARPVLVEVPHAGQVVPDDVRSELCAPEDAIRRDADMYVDRLYAHAPALGAALLVANMSRYVVDLNRAREDVDAATVSDHPAPAGAQPRGVVWRSTTDGRPILNRPLSYRALLSRLDRYYVPYHDALRRTLQGLRERFGFAILVCGHSMPSVGRLLHSDPGTQRADVVPGTRGRTSADPRVIDLVDAHFRAAGLSVQHDEPYKGGFATGHYGRPAARWHAIQVEINRALYVDEDTGEPKPGDFERLQALLDALIEKLCALDLC